MNNANWLRVEIRTGFGAKHNDIFSCEMANNKKPNKAIKMISYHWNILCFAFFHWLIMTSCLKEDFPIPESTFFLLSDETKYRLLQKSKYRLLQKSLFPPEIQVRGVCVWGGGGLMKSSVLLCYHMVLLLPGDPSEVHITYSHSWEFCIPVVHISHLYIVIFICCYHSQRHIAHLEKVKSINECMCTSNLLDYI